MVVFSVFRFLAWKTDVEDIIVSIKVLKIRILNVSKCVFDFFYIAIPCIGTSFANGIIKKYFLLQLSEFLADFFFIHFLFLFLSASWYFFKLFQFRPLFF